MIKRWIVGLIVLLLTAALLLPQLAANIDFFFSREMDRLTLNPLEGWAMVIAGGKPLQFYLLLTAAVALLLVWVLFTSSYLNYRSDMQVVTPDIITPCAAGQGQFGTARWLPKEKIPRYFGVWKVPEKDSAFHQLMDAGKNDRKEIENSHV